MDNEIKYKIGEHEDRIIKILNDFKAELAIFVEKNNTEKNEKNKIDQDHVKNENDNENDNENENDNDNDNDNEKNKIDQLINDFNGLKLDFTKYKRYVIKQINEKFSELEKKIIVKKAVENKSNNVKKTNNNANNQE